MGWSAVPHDSRTRDLIEVLISRIHNEERLQIAIDRCQDFGGSDNSFVWQDESLFSGYSGLAVLDAQLDASYPGCQWDRCGHRHLQLAVRRLNERHIHVVSCLTGAAFAASMLSRNGERYSRLLKELDSAINALTKALTDQVLMRPHGHRSSEIDAISGLTGAGAYLMCRTDNEECLATLRLMAHSLIALCGEENDVPHWYVPQPLIMQDHWREAYPRGLLDSGVAHGIAGPLALLSLMCLQGIVVDGIDEAITAIAEWFRKNRCDDDWGVNWSSVYPICGIGAPPVPSRSAWCVGSPGIARAIWLAGEALNSRGYQQLALEAMECTYRRPLPQRRIDAPGLCHGIAGLLQVTLRFLNDTRLPMFEDAAHLLLTQLTSRFDASSLLGFRDMEFPVPRDRPDLLEGVIGICLALVAATGSEPPIWDRVMLIA